MQRRRKSVQVDRARGDRRGSRVLVMLLSAGVLAAACSKESAPTEGAAPTSTSRPMNQLGGMTAGPDDATKPVDGGRIVFGMEAEPEGLDPARYAFSSSGHLVASAVYDPLATLDAGGNGVPYLAKAIEPTDSFRTWTITLPTGVTFHDGTPFNAKVAADDLEIYRQSYVTKLALQKVTSIQATDDTHVVVKLSLPMRAFPALLATQVGYMFAPAMAQDPELSSRPIGTGPFVFDSHTKDQIWSLKKNQKYWRQGLPHLDAIDFKPTPDDAKRVEGLRSGDLDITHTLRPQQVVELRKSDFKRVENGNGEEDYLLLNTEKPPFNSLTARKAVAYAADNAKWRKELMLDVEQPANSPFALGQPGYVEDSGFPMVADTARARQLVAQYKQETGNDLTFNLLTQEDIVVRNEAQLYVSFFEAAGMKVTVTALPQINLVAQTATGNYEMSRFRLFSSADPDVDASFWRSTSVLPSPNVSLNFPRYVDQRIDDAIDKALASTDDNERNTAYQTVAKLMGENLPYIWMGRPVWVMAANPRVNGIYAAANGTIQTIGAKTWLAELFITK